MDTQNAKYIQMTQTPVRRLIAKLAVPCIISMLVTSFYNMADTYFVGELRSNAATGAVSVVFSMMSVIQAIGFFFGQGSGNYISRALGSKNQEEAGIMASTGFFSAFVIGGVICLLGQLFLEPLCYLLGSTKEMLPYTKAYLGVILLGAPFMTASLVLNNQLRFQGAAMYSMVGITVGAVINVGLDYVLIHHLDMGVAGAGWATISGQVISFTVLLIGSYRGQNLRISFRKIRLKWFYYKMIFKGGLPSLARQFLAAFATASLSHSARVYGGEAAIAAMGVVQRVTMFGASAMLGFGQGFQPVCGFNYGAKLYDRVREGFWFSTKVAVVALVVAGTAGFVFAEELVGLFRDDPKVVEIGMKALRFQCVTFPVQAWIVTSNMLQQSIGRTVPATFLSVARQGVFFIPMVLILPLFLDITGIQIAQSMADVMTFLCALPIQMHVLRTLESGHKKEEIAK